MSAVSQTIVDCCQHGAQLQVCHICFSKPGFSEPDYHPVIVIVESAKGWYWYSACTSTGRSISTIHVKSRCAPGMFADLS